MQLWQKRERQSYKLHLIFQADLQTVTWRVVVYFMCELIVFIYCWLI